MTLERGTLCVRMKNATKSGGKGRAKAGARGIRHVVQVQVAGIATPFNVADSEISASLRARLEAFAGQSVEFERVDGLPRRVRPPGEAFVSSAADTSAATSASRPALGPPAAPVPPSVPVREAGAAQPRARYRRSAERGFHNPYNFVPAPPRPTSDPRLGDGKPTPQRGFERDAYTGRLRIAMRAQTPLLVPDEARPTDAEHKTYPLRVDDKGLPAIPASSVRGMLRSAFEAVTNARFGKFSRREHEELLAFRMAANEGLRSIPARVENGRFQLYLGTTGTQPQGKGGKDLYAAWLPRYGGKHDNDRQGKRDDELPVGPADQFTLRYPGGSLPQHGDAVECELERVEHGRFKYWAVRRIAPRGAALSVAPTVRVRRHTPLGQFKVVQGYVCVTNANIGNKHDERVFFNDSAPSPASIEITDAHRGMWRRLIQDYQALHSAEVEERGETKDTFQTAAPGDTAWSRHVYLSGSEALNEGTLCYLHLAEDYKTVQAIVPVTIARELHAKTPWALLPENLQPATTVSELSPADRLFGWVCDGGERDLAQAREREAVEDSVNPTPQVEPQDDRPSRSVPTRVAVRGQLRVGPVQCTSSKEDAVEKLGRDGLSLAILGAPKPQQVRFYVAKSVRGDAHDDAHLAGPMASKRDQGYRDEHGLRGRKVYPHHRGLNTRPPGSTDPDHWHRPADNQDGRLSGHYPEYQRPKLNGAEQRDSQNRTILGWVKPGAEFEFDLHVHNLSEVELGALLWLLQLPESHFLRFGGGKPLGFGSVTLRVQACDLHRGANLKARYQAWQTEAQGDDDLRPHCVKAYERAIEQAYPEYGGFEQVPFIAAFKTACTGFKDEKPVHYPRCQQAPNAEGKIFEWFVENEKPRTSNGDQPNAGFALPELTDDAAGLPYHPRSR